MRRNRIFDPDNVVFRNLARLTDVVGLSLAWLLFSLPVVTIGPASAALYHAVRRCVVEREDGTYAFFWRSFRQNFKTGLAATVLALIAAGILGIGRQVMLAAADQLGGYAVILYYAYMVLMVIPCGIACWMFPLLSRYQVNLRELLVRSAYLTVRFLPSTVVLVLLLAEVIQSCIAVFPLILAAPAVECLLASLFIERAFRRLTPIQEEGSEEAP